MNMKYTIKEIAELTGVAKSTVSKALNGQKGVSEEKRIEIMKLASEYNYIPNAAARALSHNKSETIGILISADYEYTLSTSYWIEIISAVSCEAEKNGYNLLVITQDKDDPLKSLENAIFKKSIDGLVVPAEYVHADLIKLLNTSGIPFVIQGRTPLCNHYCVDVRNKEGAYLLTSRLIENGGKNIACISGPKEFLYNKERVEGFKSALKEQGIKNPPVVHSPYTEEETVKNISAFLKQKPQIDSVFITAGGDFLFFIFDTMRKFGFDLDKIGFAVFDDYKPIHYIIKPVVSARQPIKQMGAQNARILLQLINNEEPPNSSLFDISIV
ncbi:LacI family DNA-binding transcriptional regulator [uncultured Treponema sp.]|uniref:LacI family DNA-binding transcriptional regulator n=1 Tax=uncultured Treponema sp. TaxID=162155 RepID=UPI0025D58869|nr:LacI family DNA-binding transcriptional regulator [uncultured Treponema sp.]